jgi:4-aminobutyrate aminotransferase-like enzyme/aminoglycoside phosphotransferase (APT) family kinase protein
MKFLAIEKPQFSCADVQRFMADTYGLEGTLTPLESERDQNFALTAGDGRTVVVRIANHQEPAEVISLQTAALEHVRITDPALPVPRVIRTRNGEGMTSMADSADTRHWVHVLSWLDGDVVGQRRLDTRQRYEIGRMTARLGRSLRGFFHTAARDRELLWDNRHAPRLMRFLPLLEDEGERSIAGSILERFRDETLAVLPALRAQIIHGDVHPYNVLIGKEGISGIIDFGDLVHGALIQDLANATADFLEHARDAERAAFDIIRGYHSVTGLEEDEIEVLGGLIEVRLLQTALINRIREHNNTVPDSYLASFGSRCLPLLEYLRGEGRASFATTLRRAAGLSKPHSPGQSLSVLLAKRAHHLGKSLYHFYDPPLHLVRGEGVWLHDAAGKRFLDCYNNVAHVGHCHPYVTEAIVRQARTLNTNTRYVTEAAIEYAARLTATAEPGLSAVVHVNSGSEANDVAWRMAKVWTGNAGGLVMEFAYHGITEATDAFSPSNAPEKPLSPHVRTIPPPDLYRGHYRQGETDVAAKYADLADVAIASLKEAGPGVAALLVDSAFMTNGMLEPIPGYLAALCARVRAAGGVIIADEVQAGFGRMGQAMWGYQHHGVVPDFITIGKPAGNGHPVGAVLTRPEILERFTAKAQFFSTFGGNNVSCAAGIAVLDVIHDEQLIENAASRGASLRTGLKNLMRKHDIIGNVRGSGLALGVELVADRRALTPAKKETSRVLDLVRDAGVLIGSEGQFGNILKIRPPMVIGPEHCALAIEAVDAALRRL